MFKTADQIDYEIHTRKEDAFDWECDMADAARILAGADGLSFDARCYMLVEGGMHCLRAPDVIKQYDKERDDPK
jgi:hypothetical protein